MQDVPPEISVALSVVQALTAAGRCREDAALYRPAAELLAQYLAAAVRPAPPPPPAYVTVPLFAPPPAEVAAPAPVPAPATPAAAVAPPRADAVWNPAVGYWVVPRPGAVALPVATSPPPLPHAVWHDGLLTWIVDRGRVG